MIFSVASQSSVMAVTVTAIIRCVTFSACAKDAPRMTITRTYALELDDITAVEVECNACKSKTTRPLTAQAPARCGNCLAALASPDSRDGAALKDLILLLKDFGERKSELGFGLRLQINGLDESTK